MAAPAYTRRPVARTAPATDPPPAPPASADALALFSAPVRAWFEATFEGPTQAQAEGWAAIAAGHHTLIHAPTGSGKTLAAFLWCLDRLATTPARRGPSGRARDPSATVRVLYVSPLKALTYDIERNLRAPLAGIAIAAGRLGLPVPDDRDRDPDRRHDERGAPRHRPPPAGHPHHDPRIALPHAHQRRPRGPPRASSTSSSTRSTRSPAASAAPTSP